MGRRMSLSASEKVEVIRIVADSELSIRQTLSELDISRSSFYRWYQDYQAWWAGCVGESIWFALSFLE